MRHEIGLQVLSDHTDRLAAKDKIIAVVKELGNRTLAITHVTTHVVGSTSQLRCNTGAYLPGYRLQR